MSTRVRSTSCDELGDVVVGRVGEDLLGGADLDDPAVAHHRDAVAEAHRLVEVVGDEDDRLARASLQVEQLVLHLAADQRVERAERLVHQQHVGVGGQRAGEADPLLHAAGQLVRVASPPSRRARRARAPPSALLRALLAWHALDLQAVGGVLQHRAVREQREVLEDHADLSRRSSRSSFAGQLGDVLAVELDACRRWARSSPFSIRISVDLPEPDRPMTTKISPSSTSKDASMTAAVTPRYVQIRRIGRRF